MTNIEWTDTVWNPERLDAPLRWRKPRRVFVNSMSDLFHDDVPDEFIAAVFDVIRRSHNERACHQFQILTKRPKRMRSVMRRLRFDGRGTGRAYVADSEDAAGYCLGAGHRGCTGLPNVWLGVSVEDQKAADERIPLLLQTPAAVRFISAEPLLGQLDIGMSSATCKCCDRWPSRWIRLHRPVGPDLPHLVGTKGGTHVADCGIYRAHSNPHGALSVMTPGGLLGIKPAEFDCLPGIDWVIAGGESGPGARPCDVAWIRSIVEQCKAAGVACFVKQLGANVRDRNDAGFMGDDDDAWDVDPQDVEHDVDGTRDGYQGAPVRVHLRDRKGGDPDEWPEDLRVREFPR